MFGHFWMELMFQFVSQLGIKETFLVVTKDAIHSNFSILCCPVGLFVMLQAPLRDEDMTLTCSAKAIWIRNSPRSMHKWVLLSTETKLMA